MGAAGAGTGAGTGAVAEAAGVNKLVSLFPISLTVLETAVVADSVADFSVSFKSFALVEMVSAMDAGDNGAAGKAFAMVSGAVAADTDADSESGAGANVAESESGASVVDSGATCESSIDEGASNDSEPSSGSS